MGGLEPDRHLGPEPILAAFLAALGCAVVLASLRAVAADQLHGLPTPLGVNHCPPSSSGAKTRNRHQLVTGRDSAPLAA